VEGRMARTPKRLQHCLPPNTTTQHQTYTEAARDRRWVAFWRFATPCAQQPWHAYRSIPTHSRRFIVTAAYTGAHSTTSSASRRRRVVGVGLAYRHMRTFFTSTFPHAWMP